MKIPFALPGTTIQNKTGSWKVSAPKVNPKKCIKCGICQYSCPEGIMGTPGKIPEIDFEYCKGCGICATECPVKCIEMVKVSEPLKSLEARINSLNEKELKK
jgi:2-oxoacid:acceptor oxidoreductase delta subunit (pyruvate/2-ketoisovalerate family)